MELKVSNLMKAYVIFIVMVMLYFSNHHYHDIHDTRTTNQEDIFRKHQYQARSLSHKLGEKLVLSQKEEPEMGRNTQQEAHLPSSSTTFSQCSQSINEKTVIADLPGLLNTWSQSPHSECRQLYNLFTIHYDVHARVGSLKLPKPFAKKMLQWLENSSRALQQSKNQMVIIINNKLTSEGVLINPLRQKRPKSSKGPVSEYEYATKLSNQTASTCDFCNYKTMTAYDIFGRLESDHCFTAANAFKLEQWHGLVVFKRHHPLKWTLEHFKDMVSLSSQWFEKAIRLSPTYKYRYVSWDLLPSSGSSQLHPHIHLFLSPQPFGRISSRYNVAERYSQTYVGRDYFLDLITLHSALKLDVKHGSAVALTYLTPIKNKEIIVMAPSAGTDFFELIFYMLRAYIDNMDEPSFSMFLAYPPLSQIRGEIPAIARMVTRHSIQIVRSEISSLELFASSNIDVDLFKLSQTLRKFKADQQHNHQKTNPKHQDVPT